MPVWSDVHNIHQDLGFKIKITEQLTKPCIYWDLGQLPLPKKYVRILKKEKQA